MAKQKKKNSPKKKSKPKKRVAKRSSLKGTNRRNQSRVPIQMEVRYRVTESYIVDLAEDISPGGIFIPTTHPLPKGTFVELSFGLPEGGRMINVEGRVVWSHSQRKDNRKAGMGVEFTKIDFQGQAFIDNIIHDFLRKVSIE